MEWYNILGDNKVSILDILQIYTITAGTALLAADLVALKSKNKEPILAVKITEWRKLIDYLCLSIEDDQYRVVQNNIYLSILGI